MDLNNLDSKENWNAVVTDYQDFRKIVCKFTKAGNRCVQTDDEIEEFIDQGGGDGVIQAMFCENKKNFTEGRYVFSKAAAVTMKLE